MTLRETLAALGEAARTFENGMQIMEDPASYALQVLMFDELVQMAIRKGATPFEIMRAFEGEIIGTSF
jgi:hypothetical protein